MVLSLLRVSFTLAIFILIVGFIFIGFCFQKACFCTNAHLGAQGVFKEGTKRHITFILTVLYGETLGQPVLS